MSVLKAGLGVVAASVLMLTAAGTAGAATPAKSSLQAQALAAGSGEITDFSSQRRRRVVRRGNNGGAAAAAAFMGIVGGAIAASAARDRYYDGGYHYGPGYGYGGPGYYGPAPGYGYGGGYYERW